MTYDYDFHAEIVEDGKTGYLAPLRDVATLADRVSRLLADPVAARAMGARLRSQLLHEHSLEAVVPLYRQAYDQVLGNSGRLRLRTVYALALGVWLVTRWLVLVHMGAWPWMNAFVVAAARGIIVGDWEEAVRPQLPAVLGIPLVLTGANEQQAVAAVDRADRQCGGLAGRAEPGLLHPAKHSQRRLHPKAFAAEERVLALDRCHVSAYSRISAEEPCQEGLTNPRSRHCLAWAGPVAPERRRGLHLGEQ